MKRLIILCDSTWSDIGQQRSGNVMRLAQAIRPRSADGVQQLMCYLHGTPDCAKDPDSVARAIDHDIQQAYRFLVLNYERDDELFLFGFSRGAYIVRSCIGMLRNIWLLRRPHVNLIASAYHIYRTLWGADADNALRFRETHARAVTVRFLGAWDTVGDAGIPLGLYGGLNAERYCFHDTRLSRIVEHASHALAVDERSKLLAPSLWSTRGDRSRTQQMWFSGSHLDLGGMYGDSIAAITSLRWMIDQAAHCGLETDDAFVTSIEGAASGNVLNRAIPPSLRTFGTMERAIGSRNGDEALHPSAEHRYLRDSRYRPQNLLHYLSRDEQIQLLL